MKIKRILGKFYEISNIPVGLFDYRDRIMMIPDFGIMPTLTVHDFIEFKEKGVFYKHIISNACLHHGFVYAKKEDMFIFAGMIAEHSINSSIIRETVLEYNEEKNADISNLISYFANTPKMNISRFEKYLSLLYYLVNDEDPPLYDSDIEIVNESASEHEDIYMAHNTLELEKEFLSLIEYGKTEELNKLIKNINFLGANIGTTSVDPVKNFKNIFIVSVALGSRSAINGGLNYENALSLADHYLLMVERLSKYNDIYALWVNMLMDFAYRVRKIRKLGVKNQISIRVVNYALANVYTKLSVSDIAEKLSLNRSYLSRAFKADTGKNLSMYINEIKIDEAKRLLKNTDLSLVNISILLGFTTQNYFQKVFKVVTKQTPLEYRESKLKK